jgi:hypothetical protein
MMCCVHRQLPASRVWWRSDWLSWALSALTIVLGACDSTEAIELADTEGRRFQATCDKGQCRFQRSSAAAVAPEKTEVVLNSSGRVVGICDVAPSNSPQIEDCRALICQHDRSCPPQHGLETGHCLNGVCINPEQSLSPSDAVLLCLAGTGLGRKAPKQVERFAMALNCGDPCRIPAPCRQP